MEARGPHRPNSSWKVSGAPHRRQYKQRLACNTFPHLLSFAPPLSSSSQPVHAAASLCKQLGKRERWGKVEPSAPSTLFSLSLSIECVYSSGSNHTHRLGVSYCVKKKKRELKKRRGGGESSKEIHVRLKRVRLKNGAFCTVHIVYDKILHRLLFISTICCINIEKNSLNGKK